MVVRRVWVMPLAVAVAAAMLAGCGSGGTPAAAPSATATADGPNSAAAYAERIRALPEGQRNGVFLRAIRDGRGECQEITELYESDAQGGRPTWVVTCDRENPYIVSMDANGVATVTRVSTASRLPARRG